MIKYAYTGYSGKHDGFLILTDKEWDKLAETLDAQHVVHDEDGIETDMFVLNSTDDFVIEDAAKEPKWGVWHVFREEARVDDNLTGAVCW